MIDRSHLDYYDMVKEYMTEFVRTSEPYVMGLTSLESELWNVSLFMHYVAWVCVHEPPGYFGWAEHFDTDYEFMRARTVPIWCWTEEHSHYSVISSDVKNEFSDRFLETCPDSYYHYCDSGFRIDRRLYDLFIYDWFDGIWHAVPVSFSCCRDADAYIASHPLSNPHHAYYIWLTEYDDSCTANCPQGAKRMRRYPLM